MVMKNDRLTRAERDAIEIFTAKEIADAAIAENLPLLTIFQVCCREVKWRKLKETGARSLSSLGQGYGQKQYSADIKTLLQTVYAEIVKATIDNNKYLQTALKGGE